MKGDTRLCDYCKQPFIKKKDEQVSCGKKECRRAALMNSAYPKGFKDETKK